MKMHISEAEREAVYRVIHARRDMRHFAGGEVPEHVLRRILEAGHAAPSVGLMQPWRFVRIRRTSMREALVQLVEAERMLTAEGMAEWLHARVRSDLGITPDVTVALPAGVVPVLVFASWPAHVAAAAVLGGGGRVVYATGLALLADASASEDRPRRFAQRIAVGTIAAFLAAYLAGQAAEYAGIGRDRVVAADRFEMRSCYLREETRPGSGPDRGPTTELRSPPRSSSRGAARTRISMRSATCAGAVSPTRS